MKAPERIYVEVCEDGIFAFQKPPFEESVAYIRADLVKQPVPTIMTNEMLMGEIKPKKKSNALFDKCVENCDPAVMKEVSDNVDKMLASEGLEEAKEAYCNEHNDDCFDAIGDTCPHIRKAFIAGAEWAFRQGWTFDAHKGAFGICFDGLIA